MRATFSSTRRRLSALNDLQRRSSSPHLAPFRRRPVNCRAVFGNQDFADGLRIPDAIPVASEDADWRSFRAKLVTDYVPSATSAPWVHRLPQPELGCLLISHPLMFSQQQTYFQSTVIFIFLHDHTGSAGLILNKPTVYGVKEIDVTGGFSTGFEENNLYLGGDVGDQSLNILHPFEDVKGSLKVINGVYLNGFEEAQNEVLNGRKRAGDFKWFAKYCGWHPGQLEEECENGVWFPAACHSDLVVKDWSVGEGPADMWHQVNSVRVHCLLTWMEAQNEEGFFMEGLLASA